MTDDNVDGSRRLVKFMEDSNPSHCTLYEGKNLAYFPRVLSNGGLRNRCKACWYQRPKPKPARGVPKHFTP